MINFDYVIKEETKEHNQNRPDILDHTYRMLIIGGSGSGKTNSLFNLINHQSDIDKTYSYDKDLNEAKYQFLIKMREEVGTKHFNDPKAFIEYSNNLDDIYKNIEEYNPNKKRKMLIIFDALIVDMLKGALLGLKQLWQLKSGLFISPQKLVLFSKYLSFCYDFVVT